MRLFQRRQGKGMVGAEGGFGAVPAVAAHSAWNINGNPERCRLVGSPDHTGNRPGNLSAEPGAKDTVKDYVGLLDMKQAYHRLAFGIQRLDFRHG